MLFTICVLNGCNNQSEDESITKKEEKVETTTQKEEEVPVKTKITYDKMMTYQIIDSFGASGAWWSQDVGGWSEENGQGIIPRDEVAKLLFDTETGIGLSAYRYNIGAGSEENGKSTKITDFWRNTESFITESGEYDFTKDENSVWFLKKAKEYNVDEIVFFSNSPPEALTINGNAYGTKDENTGLTSNLLESNYKAYADYILDIVEHFVNEGYNIKYVSPVNEPQWEWISGQEGCHFEPDELVAFLKVFLDEMKERKIEGVELSAPELGEWGNTSYKYYQAIINDAQLMEELTTWDVHSYWSDISAKNKFINYLTDLGLENIKLRTSEWCEMVNGKDYSMDSAINLADEIMTDLTDLSVTSFQYWIAVSCYDYRDGLIYVNKYTKELFYPKRLWAMGNFSRFIRPGYTRIQCETDNKDVRVCGFTNKEKDKIVITGINSGENVLEIDQKDFSEYENMEVYITDKENSLELIETGEIPGESVFTILLY